MRVEIYFVSSSKNRASTRSFFKLPFEWSVIPSTSTETAVPVEGSNGNFVLKGVFADVWVEGNLGKVLFGTETSSEDMQGAILPGGLRLREVSDWLLD